MFWNKPIISSDLRDWIEDNFDWVENNRPDWLKNTTLVLPTKAFFTAPGGTGHDIALAVMQDVKRLLKIDRQIKLEALPELPDELQHQYGQLSQIAGEYWHDDEVPVITYRPNLLRQPLGFINTMAHELIHARLAPVAAELPGGDAAHELATDLHCIIAGFGVIQLQAAEQLGWTGYMTQASRAVALAEFMKRANTASETALQCLSTRPKRWLKKALKA